MDNHKMWNNDQHDRNKEIISPNPEIEIVGNDFPTTSASLHKRKSACLNLLETGGLARDEDQSYVEITLDVCLDSVSVVRVKSIDGSEDAMEPEQLKRVEKRASTIDSATIHNVYSRRSLLEKVSRELKRFVSLTAQEQWHQSDRTKFKVDHALKGMKFISKTDGNTNWIDVERRFDKLTPYTDGCLLPRYLFGICIGMNKVSDNFLDQNEKEIEDFIEKWKEEKDDFAFKLFDALCRRQNIPSDSINKAQLKDFWDMITDESFDSRLQIFFCMVDKDEDGRITQEDVKEIIAISASINRLSKIQKHADEYAALLMEELDPYNCGYITIDALEMILLEAPSQSIRGDSKNLSQMISERLKPTKLNPIGAFFRYVKYFFLDNWKRVWVISLWVVVMVVLFVWKFIQYRNRSAYDVMGHCVAMAKGAAETLKLNMALILMPVCRNTITWVRSKTRLGIVVPFDDNLSFHKVIAVAIAIGVWIHGIYHLACDFPRLIDASPEKYEPMVQYFGKQPTSYWHFVKSFEGISGIVMVVLMTIAFTLATPLFRRKKISLPKAFNKFIGFNAFWYSHHLFVIVYGLLIAHGIKLYLTNEWYKKTTWMYLTIPMTLYGCERLTRAFRSSIKTVQIQKVLIYPANVLSLHMSKPDNFMYKSGQYMFVNCATVSPFEWHPFSITSAPGDDYLSVHIRNLGDWTKKLKDVFSEVCLPPVNNKSGVHLLDDLNEENNLKMPTVRIDGPYGAPAQDYKKYDIVLLVGLGIGATPMISILKDIMNNIKGVEEEDKFLENGNGRRRASPSNQFKTRKAYFYWVTREQGSFDWFKGVMNEVTKMVNTNVIEMNIYCTSVYEDGDARSALITMLQSLNHAKHGVDVVSDTSIKCHFAKPNWRNVYKRIAVMHPNSRVGVFYCGAPGLTKELKQLALNFTHKTTTKFDFNKENF